MRLIFALANIDTLAWLNRTAQFGVGSVGVDPQHSSESVEVERPLPANMIAQAKAMKLDPKELKKMEAQKIKVTLKRPTKNPVVYFAFHEDGDVDAVKALAEQAGLKFIEQRGDVTVKKSDTRIMPPPEA